MIQRRVQISAVVFWPVVADRLLHRLVASDHSGRPVIAVQAVRDLRRLSKAVPVDLRFFCPAVICDNNVRPLAHREKLGTAAAYFDIVRLFIPVGRTDRKCKRSRVVQGRQIPSVCPPLVFIPCDDLLAGKRRVRFDPEGQCQVRRLQFFVSAKIHICTAGQAQRLAAVCSFHPGMSVSGELNIIVFSGSVCQVLLELQIQHLAGQGLLRRGCLSFFIECLRLIC